MSIIHANTVKSIAQSVDIPKLSDEAAKTLAPDVEYRLREVVQEALKFAKHAKRTKLTTEDINDALKLRNVQPVYGFGSRDPAKFLRVSTHPELMYVRDPELNYQQLIEAPLPKLPREAGVAVHWLAINGVQPDLPENAAIEQPPAKRQRVLTAQRPAGQEALAAAATAAGSEGHASLSAPGATPAAVGAVTTANAAAAAAGTRLLPGQAVNPRAAAATASVHLQLPVRHAVSRELQVYFDKIVGLLLTAPVPTEAATAGAAALHRSSGAGRGVSSNTAAAGAVEKHQMLLRGAFASVAADPGLHPLVPYFTAFIADGVVQHLDELWLLDRLLQLARALLTNPAVHMEPYLQQLLPAVMTCLVTRTLGSHPLDDHWALRRQAAALLASIAAKFSAPHHNLAPRLCRVLAQAFLDPCKPLTSKYGAVVGLQALGPQVVRTLLIPHLEPLMISVLFPAMASDTYVASSSCEQQQQPAGSSSSALQQQRQKQQQLELQRMEAWQVYSALLSATGAAMYDLLIGQLQGQLPAHLLLARRGHTGLDWETEYVKTMLAAKRPVKVRLAVRSDGEGIDLQLQLASTVAGAADAACGDVEMKAANGDFTALNGAADGHDAACGSGSKPLRRVQSRGLIGGGLAASKARKRAGSSKPGDVQQQEQHTSIAEVLGQSWKEDSDVNATLGALLHLFGEDLLPCLPLPNVAAVSL